jgi:hypothetical protein
MVLSSLGSESDLFYLDVFLCFFGFLTFLFLFVEEFSKIHHLADWWIGIRRDLYQVKISFPGDVLGFFYRNYSYVFPCRVNKTNFANPDTIIRPIINVSYFFLLLLIFSDFDNTIVKGLPSTRRGQTGCVEGNICPHRSSYLFVIPNLLLHAFQ